jgi:hypothetical protein
MLIKLVISTHVNGCWQAKVYTKKCYSLIVFSTYPNFMHQGGNLENNFHYNFVKDDGSYPNLALCFEINAHMNDIIVQQSNAFLQFQQKDYKVLHLIINFP